MTTQRALRARIAVSLAAVAIGLGMVVAHTGGSGYTEAAWQDREVGQASVKAEWATGGWARSTSNSYTNYASYWDRTWLGSPVDATTKDRINNQTSAGSATNTHGERDLNANFEVTTPYTLYPGKRPNAVVRYCIEVANPMATLSGNPTNCGGAPSYTTNYAQARAKGSGVSGGFANPSSASEEPILWVEAHDIRTMAECAPDGTSRALTPTSSFPATAGNGKIGFMSSATKIAGSNADQHFVTLDVPSRNKRTTKWILPKYRSLAGWDSGRVYFRATLTARAHEAPGYALSDLYVTLDQYRVATPNQYLGSFTMVFSRSECGVTTPSRDHRPLASEFEALNPPNYPPNPGSITIPDSNAPLPHVNGALPASFTSTALRGLQGSEPTTSELPPATTMTSSTEHTTASETTTSAPPNPDDVDGQGEDDEDDTADPTSPSITATTTTRTTTTTTPPTTRTPTTTSAPPTIVVPDEPADLSATARTAEAGIVEVDGEELVVVVRGTTVPADARTSLAALDTWINDARQPSGDWTTFTSTDPDEDGWRWAAINQKTGTVVYIR